MLFRSDATLVLSDAMPFNVKDKRIVDYIKGDSLSISIAAASIIAKVTRDCMMDIYDEAYPDYGFKRHKGYQTKEHKDALAKYGVLPIHRRSYEPVRQRLLTNLFDV